MFRMEIETDNDAFQNGNDLDELARILRETADKLESAVIVGKVRDINGATVGRFHYQQED